LWSALGVALRRYAATTISPEDESRHLVYFDMAERAYCWASAVIDPFKDRAGYRDSQQSLMDNLQFCISSRNSGAKQNLEALRTHMKRQRKQNKKEMMKKSGLYKTLSTSADGGNMIEMKSSCLNCGATECQEGTPLKKCSGCRTVYFCSGECQKAAWKEHKIVCRGGAKKKKKKKKRRQ